MFIINIFIVSFNGFGIGFFRVFFIIFYFFFIYIYIKIENDIKIVYDEI